MEHWGHPITVCSSTGEILQKPSILHRTATFTNNKISMLPTPSFKISLSRFQRKQLDSGRCGAELRLYFATPLLFLNEQLWRLWLNVRMKRSHHGKLLLWNLEWLEWNVDKQFINLNIPVTFSTYICINNILQNNTLNSFLEHKRYSNSESLTQSKTI